MLNVYKTIRLMDYNPVIASKVFDDQARPMESFLAENLNLVMSRFDRNIEQIKTRNLKLIQSGKIPIITQEDKDNLSARLIKKRKFEQEGYPQDETQYVPENQSQNLPQN